MALEHVWPAPLNDTLDLLIGSHSYEGNKYWMDKMLFVETPDVTSIQSTPVRTIDANPQLHSWFSGTP